MATGPVARAYRRAARLTHPDAGGDARDFRRCKEAHDLLQRIRHAPAVVERVGIIVGGAFFGGTTTATSDVSFAVNWNNETTA